MQTGQTLIIEFIGFTQIEKAPFLSILSLSKCRPVSYREKGSADKADLYLVNSDRPNTQQIVQSHNLTLATSILIGDANPIDPAWKHMPKPVRWVRLFDMLDEFSDSLSGIRSSEIQIPVPAAPQTLHDASRPSAFGRVLVVDDNETVRRFMAQKLNPFRFDVDFAESGEEALRFARQTPYVCIFLDVVMAGIDGYQVCRLLKQTPGLRSTSIVMLTSRDSPLDRIKGKMAGCDGYLTKPVEEEKLLDAFSRFLSTHETGIPA
jgi:two-component system cell cycle response regulator